VPSRGEVGLPPLLMGGVFSTWFVNDLRRSRLVMGNGSSAVSSDVLFAAFCFVL
jgi:hypothetical protein